MTSDLMERVPTATAYEMLETDAAVMWSSSEEAVVPHKQLLRWHDDGGAVYERDFA